MIAKTMADTILDKQSNEISKKEIENSLKYMYEDIAKMVNAANIIDVTITDCWSLQNSSNLPGMYSKLAFAYLKCCNYNRQGKERFYRPIYEFLKDTELHVDNLTEYQAEILLKDINVLYKDLMTT